MMKCLVTTANEPLNVLNDPFQIFLQVEVSSWAQMAYYKYYTYILVLQI